MLKKLIIIMLITLSSIHHYDVQANTKVLSKLPDTIQQRLDDLLNNQEDDLITETKITSTDGVNYDFFGQSVAIDGTTLVVGAYYITNPGSVYLYDLTIEIGDATFERKITASDGSGFDNFGASVAIDSTTLVVGANRDDDGYERKIIASDGAAQDYFGWSVAIDGTTLVVGAHENDNNGVDSGSVYVYDLTKTSGDEGFETKITASDGASSDHFGWPVAIDGTTLVVGARLDDDNGVDSGSVYVYDLTKTIGDDGFERKIIAYDGREYEIFGISVALDGSKLVVGSYNDDYRAGVYVYDLTKTSGEVGYERKIKASDISAEDFFGYSVAIDGTTLVVGAYNNDDNGEGSGSVYVYDLTKTSGEVGFERKINASDGTDYDYFGYSVAIDGTTLVVGAYFDDDNGTNSGSVYVYNGTFGSGNTKTDEEWASEITTMIDLLTAPYVRADVEAARTAYDNLTEAQQALVTNYQTLLNAEQALADIDAAAAVDALIDGLSEPYDPEAVQAAREAYESLTEEQQELVTELPTLETYEKQVAPQDATGIIFFMLIFIGVISAVIYFSFYKRDREKNKISKHE